MLKLLSLYIIVGSIIKFFVGLVVLVIAFTAARSLRKEAIAFYKKS